MKSEKKEGRKILTLTPMSYVSPYVMKTRGDATNYYGDRVEISRAESYIREKKKQGLDNFNLMYLIISAYVRTAAGHPEINRFIRGQKIYARNGIVVILTIKLSMEVNAPETVLKVTIPPDATAEEVYRLLRKEVELARTGDSDFDGVAKAFHYIPGLVLRTSIAILNGMDYFGLMPKKLIRVSPFHGSFAITSTASLRIQPIYHHLYNFGNIPVFCAFGNSYYLHALDKDGKPCRRKYVDLKFTLDERITDGYGYAAVFHRLKYLLQNPSCLDERPEEVRRDID